MIAAAVSASLGLFILASLSTLICNQALDGKIQRNSAFGIRTFQTQKSDAAWIAGHEAANPTLRATGLLAAIFGTLLIVTGVFISNVPWVSFGTAALGYIVAIGGFLAGVVKANRAAKTVA